VLRFSVCGVIVCLAVFQVQSEKTSHRKKSPKLPPREQESADNTLILEPGSFDVVLLVDKKETAG
jgi:hypothetical protein